MRADAIDITGQRFGSLVALCHDDKVSATGRRKWKCKCDCGATHYATSSHLRNGDVISCGCKSSRPRLSEIRSQKAHSQDHKQYLNQRSMLVASGCIEWTKAKTTRGYGAAFFRARYKLAHRLSYEAHIGQIPDGMFVCHRCDNPACINPEHLFLGSHQDNMTDKVMKARHCHGETHGMHKLSEDQALRILTRGESQNALAAELGITPEHVGAIRAGKAWKHIQGVRHAA